MVSETRNRGKILNVLLALVMLVGLMGVAATKGDTQEICLF